MNDTPDTTTQAAPQLTQTHTITGVEQAVEAKQIQALPNQSRNVQQALRMANDATGLLQKA
jgi:hypothetical protein